mmetsp:Transcript_32364/g.47565  ORF Transcript_32364/g.47565 Transcript_32364/m.47565 type:complete len:211 (+) Transcript_32364:166-798(+)
MRARHHVYMLSSMIALTMSPSLFLRAATALARVVLACCMTSSMSLGLTPSSSAPSSAAGTASPSASVSSGTSSSFSSVSWVAPAWNCLAADSLALALRSSTLASPKTMKVSLLGILKTSGLLIPKRIVRDFLTVTRVTLGKGFIPSFCMRRRAFFSLRFWRTGASSVVSSVLTSVSTFSTWVSSWFLAASASVILECVTQQKAGEVVVVN